MSTPAVQALNTKRCRLCDLDKPVSQFTGKTSNPDGYANECRGCQRIYRDNRDNIRWGAPLIPYLSPAQQQANPTARPQHPGGRQGAHLPILGVTPAPVVAQLAPAALTGTAANRVINQALRSAAQKARTGQVVDLQDEIDEGVSLAETIAEKAEQLAKVDETVKDLKPGDYIQSAEVLATWVAVQKIAKSGLHAPNLLFKGPSGSGKTEAAKDLAKRSELPFFKVDASAMVDPEAWFGTREVVVEDGAPKTVYVPSAFVEALEQPCVLLIDEINRVADAVRNILIPLFDDSRQVTNPLTGQIVKRHPLCFVIMTGNVGIAFTGTYAIDPALLTRALTTNFTYLAVQDEIAVVVARTGIDKQDAATLVRFADDTRKKSATDEDFLPVSTREVLSAAFLVAQGLDMTTAVRQSVINSASEEGGAESQRAQLEYLWKGIYKSA